MAFFEGSDNGEKISQFGRMLTHLIILIMLLSLIEVMMEVVQASVFSSMEMVSPTMWAVAKEKLALKPVGGNSKLQPMATAATHGNGNLRIHGQFLAEG